MATFYSPTSMNLKYQVLSSVEIPEAGKNFGGKGILTHGGEIFKDLDFNYWVTKEVLDTIIEKYNAIKTYI